MNGKRLFLPGVTFLLAGLMLGSIGQAQEEHVATIQEPQGRVLVNQGEEYVIGRQGMKLYVGDRIVTMDASKTRVKYQANDCEAVLDENSQLTVVSAEECRAAGAVVAAADSGGPVSAIGADTAVSPPLAPAPAVAGVPEITFPFQPSFVTPFGIQDIGFYALVVCGVMESTSSRCGGSNSDNSLSISPE